MVVVVAVVGTCVPSFAATVVPLAIAVEYFSLISTSERVYRPSLGGAFKANKTVKRTAMPAAAATLPRRRPPRPVKKKLQLLKTAALPQQSESIPSPSPP